MHANYAFKTRKAKPNSDSTTKTNKTLRVDYTLKKKKTKKIRNRYSHS